MKTEMALLLMNDGCPTLKLKKWAELFGIEERTARNWVSAKTVPVPVFKLGAEWCVHVSDMARHIDAQRASVSGVSTAAA